MRLAFCNATKRWGGVKTWSVEFAAALQQRGHKVFIYGRDKEFIARAENSGLEAFAVDFGFDYNPASISRFCREYRQKGIEAVLVNVGKDLRTAGVAARLCGIPLVQRIGLPGDMRNSLKVRLTHKLLRPHYLCPCYYIRDGMLRELPFINAAETSVIYSAKHPISIAPDFVSQPLRILSSSQVNPNKGHAELAHCLRLLQDEGFAFSWEIAGTGSSLDALRALCLDLGIADSVVFHGFVQDLPALLSRCDLFVLSSYTEGLPNTLLEAMAHGLVPVARDVGGVKECWPPSLPWSPVKGRGDEQQRDWYAPGKYSASELPLYEPLRRIFQAPRQSLLGWKKEAWLHCRENFSLDAQAEKLERFFMDLSAGGGTHPGS